MKSMAGPAMRICPECGLEIGREILHTQRGSFVLPLPRTCPLCDARLDGPVHQISKDQRTLECEA